MLEQSTKLVPDEHGIFTCNFGAISLRFQAHKQAPVTLVAASGAGMEPIESMPNQRDAQPIVEMVATESGTHDNRIPLTRSIAGSILRFVSATYTPSAHKYQPNRLEITQFASFDDLHPNGRDYGEDYTITDFDSATDCATPTENSEGVTVTSVYEAYPQVSAVVALPEFPAPTSTVLRRCRRSIFHCQQTLINPMPSTQKFIGRTVHGP